MLLNGVFIENFQKNRLIRVCNFPGVIWSMWNKFIHVFDRSHFCRDGERACSEPAPGACRPECRCCSGLSMLESTEQSLTSFEIWATCPFPYARRFYSAFSQKGNIEHKSGARWP